MKSFLILLLAVGCAVASLDPGLRVKFDVGLRPGTDFFFDIPRTITQAIIARWWLTPRTPGPRPTLSLYCHGDFTVCVYFDDTGNVAGLQIALDQDEFSENAYEMEVTGFYEWEVTTASQTIRKFWAIAMYFVSDEYLEIPAADRDATRDSTKFLQEDALWLTGFNGVIDKVSSEESEIQNSIYTKQACIPWMGQHYYHNMRKDLECLADTIYPWFPITDTGKLMAVGMMVSGIKTTKDYAQNWFEYPNRLAVSVIVPDGPECLYKLAENPGVVTMHVYFIDAPWSIGCPLWKSFVNSPGERKDEMSSFVVVGLRNAKGEGVLSLNGD